MLPLHLGPSDPRIAFFEVGGFRLVQLTRLCETMVRSRVGTDSGMLKMLLRGAGSFSTRGLFGPRTCL
jgi:hypothetical protein